MEQGARGISAVLLFRIAEATRTDTAELLGEDPGTIYMVADPGKGLLDTKPRDQWPDFLKVETPTTWPGTLRSFVASVGADMMRLIPDEIPLLARMALVGESPSTEAEWVFNLSLLRILIGAGGRPVLLAMVPAKNEGGSEGESG